MNKLVLLFFLSGILQAKTTPTSQNLKVIGFTSNVVSGAKVPGVCFYTVLNNQRKLLCAGDSQGRFRFELPAGGDVLIIEKNGFRSINTKVSTFRNDSENSVFYVRFPLIPLDKQDRNVPYMQSEQKQYTLTEVQKEKNSLIRTFFMVNALNGKPILNGKICFQFTRDGRKDCQEVSARNHGIEIEFTETDIVGFVVEAPGYESYTGNLIVDKIENGKDKYEIRISPETTTFSLNVSGAPASLTCSLTSTDGKKLVMQRMEKNSFYSLLDEGNYGLKVSDTKGAVVYAANLNVAKGLNFIGITAKQASAIPETKEEIQAVNNNTEPAQTKDSFAFDSLGTVTIRFNQGEYKLIPSEQNQLNELAAFLKANAKQKIRIVGHTDNVGDPLKNIMLSEHRAKVVRKYLTDKDVSEAQIYVAGVGSRFPTSPNDSEENKKLNRRVIITMLP